MKNILLSLIFSAFAVLCFADDLTDITSSYLQNPSFEADDTSALVSDGTRNAFIVSSLSGWTLSSSLSSGYGVCDLMTAAATATDNDFGAPGSPSDGEQMLYLRDAWTVSSVSLLQSITLPAGSYKLTVDNKFVTSSSHAAYIVAGDGRSSISSQSSMPSTWNTAELSFSLSEETTLNVGLSVSFANASGGSLLIDNFRLYEYPEGYEQPEESDVSSPTEDVITSDFVPEAEMMPDLLQMLANFSQYMVDDFYDCAAPNSVSEDCGYFNGESSGQANEAGVRTNADLSMLCAFLVKYAKPAGVTLPDGVSWDRIAEIARKSLVFAYSTHKANKLKVCAGSTSYWGSTSTSDYVWESSLWALSVAYSAYFQWESLSEAQRTYVYNMLKAECNYELARSIPTGYSGDTKAEENGWEADILAATLGLFPDDELAENWFSRLREFAINSYSHYRDAADSSVIDPLYNNVSVSDLYLGNNLYGDYTLQNHNLFHTSYQNVVMQELGEAALALLMFQGDNARWQTASLMHNNQEVMDSVLNWLALTDGELAMPNGNDWSLFLYDQITSYSTQACFQRDPNALMLENMAYKYIKARQQTTTDGSWLLRPDVGARRMGVEGHRVMMTYLMHLALSTADLAPTDWETFRSTHSEARLLPYQNVVRAFTPDRFTTFSWSTGLSSYTGYFASNTPDKNKILVPYRANNTGNLIGWYTVNGKSTDASPVVSGIYDLKGDGYTMNGELKTNSNTLDCRFALYSTPGNAIIYLDYVTGLSTGTVTGEYGGLLAISTDELTKLKRTLYYDDAQGGIAHSQLDGTSLTTFSTDWLCIDNALGVVGSNGKKMAFGDRAANNSIYTSKLYPMYSNTSRTFQSGSVVDRRNLVYYSNVSAETTAQLASQLQVLTNRVPEGWNAVIASDPDSTCYLLVANFLGEDNDATLSGLQVSGKAPVFSEPTTITDSSSSVTLSLQQNHSAGRAISFLVEGTGLVAQLDTDSAAYITASQAGDFTVTICQVSRTISIEEGETLLVSLDSTGNITAEQTSQPQQATADPQTLIVNPYFDEGTLGWEGSPTVSYSAAEKYNTTFDVYQTVTGLTPGRYLLSCQGFYRCGSYSSAASARTADTEALNAKLYAHSSLCDADTSLVSIFSEAGNVGTVGVSQSPYGYIPNTMEQASFYFLAGLYPNQLECVVGSDGELTIGVKKTVSVSTDWTIFDTFSLTYLGENDEEQTGISGLPATDPFHRGGVYTLSGVRVASDAGLAPGIYIIDGKKVVR